MSQVLQGGVGGSGSIPQTGSKPVIGVSGASAITGSGAMYNQTPTQPINMLASPTAGMPGVLPGTILTGHLHKPITTQTINMVLPSGDGVQSASANGAATTTTINMINLANTKEKTPMCLINELARFNKIQHTYTLTDEQGPAHKKVFYVKLKLGEEEYAANGPSIKKAQHAAAAVALEASQYKHPPPKPPRSPTEGGFDDEVLGKGNPSITPTVELNAMAMKLGQPAIYRPLEPARNNFYPPNLNFRGMYNQRYHQPRYPRVFYVSLKVGQREFIGEGNTRQSARHNAAEKALKVLSVLPITSEEIAKCNPEKIKDIIDGEEGEENDPLKSEISLVHEIALKRNLNVTFEVIKESGPPHMKTFVTRCNCGQTSTEGEGNSKKLSKKRAAEKMLEELQGLPSVNMQPVKVKKNPNKKKNNRNLIKKADPEYGVGINPISRLIQIQQAKKEKEPVYTLVAEKGMPRRKEFVVQVSVGEQSCTGVGPNKKLAKRNAAEAMLQMLGYSRPAPQPSKPAIKTEGGVSPSGDKKVTFLDTQEVSHNSRQLVPGVLLMPDVGRAMSQPMYSQPPRSPGQSFTPNADPLSVKYSPQTTAAIAKELLDTGCSPTAEAINKQGLTAVVGHSVVRPKQQLLYLAEVLGFQVEFTDFPKSGKKGDYLSLVSLSTNPPQVSHGGGHTIDAAHDMAALTALKALSATGLEGMADNKDSDGKPPNDGSLMKTSPEQ